jgi:hypothetical protein
VDVLPGANQPAENLYYFGGELAGVHWWAAAAQIVSPSLPVPLILPAPHSRHHQLQPERVLATMQVSISRSGWRGLGGFLGIG